MPGCNFRSSDRVELAGIGAGAFKEARALPLHVQCTRRVFLGSANLFGDGLEPGCLFDKKKKTALPCRCSL
jgi:hypothetical protein